MNQKYIVLFRETEGHHKELTFFGWVPDAHLQVLASVTADKGKDGFVAFENDIDPIRQELIEHVSSGSALVAFEPGKPHSLFAVKRT